MAKLFAGDLIVRTEDKEYTILGDQLEKEDLHLFKDKLIEAGISFEE